MGSEQPAPSTTANNDASPLFQLPLELREAIYSHLSSLHNIAAINDGSLPGDSIPVKFCSPGPEAYLICQQLTAELEHYLRRSQTRQIVVRDQLLCLGWPQDIRPACRDLRVPLVASLIVTCATEDVEDGSVCDHPDHCAGRLGIAWHIDAVRLLCKHFVQLEALHVDLYVGWHKDCRRQWPRSRHHDSLEDAIESFALLPGLTRLRVFKLYERGSDDLEGQQDLWVSWTGEGGWEAPEELDA